jgi:hypothetical protein
MSRDVIWDRVLVLRGERGPTTRAPVEPDYEYGWDAGKPDKLGHTPFAAGPCVGSGLGEERDVGDAQNCPGARVPAGRRSAWNSQWDNGTRHCFPVPAAVLRCVELRVVPSLPSPERQVVDPIVFTGITGRPSITPYSRTSRVHVECSHTKQKIWHIRLGSTAKPGMPARRLSLKSILTVQWKSQKVSRRLPIA